MNNNEKYNRYLIISVLTIILFFVLTFQYAKLTLVEGEHYRELSDTKRVRTIVTTAPRGEIRDRNGVLIAGNKASFTVQIMKDALNSLSNEERNEVELSLIRLLEDDGVDYLSDFPVNFNTLKYIGPKEGIDGETNPSEIIVKKILDNNLVRDFIACDFSEYSTSDFYKFTIGDRVVKSITDKHGENPLVFTKSETGYSLSLNGEMNLDEWFTANGMDPVSDPYRLLNNYLETDRGYIRKTLSHPISRKAIYEMLKSKGLANEIGLNESSISYEDDLVRQKQYLMTLSDEVTLNSAATDDFVNVFEVQALRSFANKVYKGEGNTKATSIQNEMISFLEGKGIDTGIEITISSDETYNIYKYDDGINLNGVEPGEYLLNILMSNKLLKEFLIQDSIKYKAQSALIDMGINPRISIGEYPFEYVSTKELNSWLKQENISYKEEKSFTLLKNKDRDTNESVETVESLFAELRHKWKISEELSDYEARAMLSINLLIKNQGYLAYQPINFAYGVSDKTVARLKEGFGNKTGIQISVEPVRYYPFNEVGSHILGYIGKISQDREITEYVDEKGYQKTDLIGKTGLEQAYEDVLRGKPGKKVIEIDAYGYTTAEIEETSGIQGNTIYTSHDIYLQKFVEEKLIETMKAIRTASSYKSPWGDYKYEVDPKTKIPYNANTGATIVQEVKTGKVLAMASVPSFNPNLFATGISNDDYQSLFPENEKDLLAPRPLYNIATQTAIQPGSVFKMITAMSALEKGWSPTKRIKDMGQVIVGNRPFKCWYFAQYSAYHAAENLADAIKDSCNYYFYSLALGENQRSGERIGVQISIQDINDMAVKFGLNDKTGIEIKIPSENSGGVPEPEKKAQITQNMLNYYLRANIKKYVVDDKRFQIEEAINEILSWTNLEIEPPRSKIIKDLTDMGLDPLTPLKGKKDGLADLIKYTYLKDSKWTMADTLNITIGQGQNAYTPIQISNYVSSLANGGKLYRVSTVESIRTKDGEMITEIEPEYTEIELRDKRSIDHVTKGMKDLVKTGSIKGIFKDFPMDIAAKTGSAEKEGINPSTNKEYAAFAWFVAYAPAEDPEIAITTLIFQGRTGSNAAPMTRDIIAEYFDLKPTGQGTAGQALDTTE